MHREILLVGSVPLRPAEAVFDIVARTIGPSLRRMPDGDQHGWILAAVGTHAENELLEALDRVEISRGGAEDPRYRLRDGVASSDLRSAPTAMPMWPPPPTRRSATFANVAPYRRTCASR